MEWPMIRIGFVTQSGLLLLLFSLVGCNAIKTRLQGLDVSTANHQNIPSDVADAKSKIGTVRVQRWLGNAQAIEIRKDDRQLQSVLSKVLTEADNSDRRRLKQLVGDYNLKAKNAKAPGLRLKASELDDNVVVIRRGGEYWYLIQPWMSRPELANLPLKNGDFVTTIPLSRLPFQSRLPEKKTAEVRMAGPWSKQQGLVELERRKIPFSQLIQATAAKSLFKENASVCIVTRVKDGKVRHLVMPLDVENGIFSQWFLNAHHRFYNATLGLADGDLVRATELSVFLALLK